MNGIHAIDTATMPRIIEASARAVPLPCDGGPDRLCWRRGRPSGSTYRCPFVDDVGGPDRSVVEPELEPSARIRVPAWLVQRVRHASQHIGASPQPSTVWSVGRLRTVAVDGDRVRPSRRTGVDARRAERGRSAAHRSWARPGRSNWPTLLPKEAFDEVLVSPLVRARADRRAAARRARTATRRSTTWLEEIRDPMWHGTPSEKAADAYAELRGRPAEERWSGLDGGESVRDFVARIRSRRGGASSPIAAWCAARSICRSGRSRSRAPGSLLDRPRRAPTRSRSVTCSACRRPRGSGTASCSATASISRLEAMPLHDGYTFCLSKLSDVEHLGARRPHAVGRRSQRRVGTSVYRRAHDRRAPSIPICEALLVQRVHAAERRGHRRDDPSRRPARSVRRAGATPVEPLTADELADAAAVSTNDGCANGPTTRRRRS